ncbi:DoxX family protein [Vibrio salinus]|uniref:DoxX family protein n=1 Tax=Vibrio salinus TaxID=2899784 RepID=UPI001E5F54F9|nr:DoxX family protein [Vibrio salinus]MCE0493388.1 DoxX family protein [Vibrio salinus]
MMFIPQRYQPAIESFVLLLGRLSLACVFWLSGQTKVEGFKLNIINGDFSLGIPKISDTTFFLFEHEYALPIIPFHIAAYMATAAEHLFPILLILGLFTRFSAFSLAIMTLVIQIFVYPDAYATHLTWLSVCGFLMLKGAGNLSVDAKIKGSQA